MDIRFRQSQCLQAVLFENLTVIKCVIDFCFTLIIFISNDDREGVGVVFLCSRDVCINVRYNTIILNYWNALGKISYLIIISIIAYIIFICAILYC